MVRWARGLYLTKLGPREVLAECYGVTFADEFFMIVDADAHPGFTTNLPWHLAVPLVALMGERKAETPPPRVPHGSLIHCYRLSELAAGRSIVTGVPWRPEDGGGELSTERSGESLRTVPHEYYDAEHRLNEWGNRQPWSWGSDTIGEREVAMSHERVAEIEELQRRLRDRTEPT